MTARSVRDQLPDDWVRCSTCLGAGSVKVILDSPAQRCSACGGTGEVLREPAPIRRRR